MDTPIENYNANAVEEEYIKTTQMLDMFLFGFWYNKNGSSAFAKLESSFISEKLVVI